MRALTGIASWLVVVHVSRSSFMGEQIRFNWPWAGRCWLFTGFAPAMQSSALQRRFTLCWRDRDKRYKAILLSSSFLDFVYSAGIAQRRIIAMYGTIISIECGDNTRLDAYTMNRTTRTNFMRKNTNSFILLAKNRIENSLHFDFGSLAPCAD